MEGGKRDTVMTGCRKTSSHTCEQSAASRYYRSRNFERYLLEKPNELSEGRFLHIDQEAADRDQESWSSKHCATHVSFESE